MKRSSILSLAFFIVLISIAQQVWAPPVRPPGRPSRRGSRQLDLKNPQWVQRVPLHVPQDPCAQLNTSDGFVEMDLPWSVTPSEEFGADVSIQPCKDAPATIVEVRMEQTSDTLYDPRVFSLKPGEHQLVKIKVLKSEGGLAQIIATPQRPWLPESVSLDVGFSAILRPRVDETIEAGSIQPVSLDLVDADGQPVSIGAPLSVRVATEKSQLRSNATSVWSDELEFQLQRGATSTPSFQLKAPNSAPDRDVLASVVSLNGSYALRDQKFPITIVPQWWLQLAVGILGGLLHAVSKMISDYSKAKRRAKFAKLTVVKLVTGVVAGCVAYLLASWNVVGIRIDTTSLRAFAVLGFLLSYVGVDAVIRRLVPERDNLRESSQNDEPPLKPSSVRR
jgi:hypothetical protein